jgi:cation diffusion facilitator CzcD-associated flavoprotein CzcO
MMCRTHAYTACSVLEKGDGVGGTWYWNAYPGARCDVPSIEYSYSDSAFPGVEQVMHAPLMHFVHIFHSHTHASSDNRPQLATHSSLHSHLHCIAALGLVTFMTSELHTLSFTSSLFCCTQSIWPRFWQQLSAASWAHSIVLSLRCTITELLIFTTHYRRHDRNFAYSNHHACHPAKSQEWEWTECMAAQPEIERYANHIADRFDLRRDIQFNTKVTSMSYDDTSARWTVASADGTARTARFVVAATGALSAPSRPKLFFEAKDVFDGPVYLTGE